MTTQEAVEGILETVSPVFSGDIVPVSPAGGAARNVFDPWTLVSEASDEEYEAAGKLLQLFANLVTTDGSFMVVLESISSPFVQPEPKPTMVVPKYHPPGERRFWERSQFRNPNPRPT